MKEKTNQAPADKPKRFNKKERMQQRTERKLKTLKQKKNEVEKKLSVAQSATASMGRFDKKAHKDERQIKVHRRKQYRNFKNIHDQVERNKQVLEQVLKAQGLKKLNHSL